MTQHPDEEPEYDELDALVGLRSPTSPSSRGKSGAASRSLQKRAEEARWYHYPLLLSTYGLVQGTGQQLWSMGFMYYFRHRIDSQHLQFYDVLVNIPWDMKPFWGLIGDAYPPRDQYLRSAALIGALAFFIASTGPTIPQMLVMLWIGSLSLSVIDVMVDAIVVEKVRHMSEDRSADLIGMTTLANIICSAAGGLIKGPAQTHLGSSGQFRLQSFFIFVVFFFGIVDKSGAQRNYAGQSMKNRLRFLLRVIPFVWQPLLYAFLKTAIVPNFSSMWFYFLTTKESGPQVGHMQKMPNFSPQFIGIMSCVMSISASFAVYVYQQYMITWSFRRVLIMTHLLQFMSGFLDIPMILRWNVHWGVSDKEWILLSDDIIHPLFSRLQLVPYSILVCQYLCPPGLEATIFAISASMHSLGADCGKSTGAVIEGWVTSWMPHYIGGLNPEAVAVCMIIRQTFKIIPIFLPFWLIPDGRPGKGPSKESWKKKLKERPSQI